MTQTFRMQTSPSTQPLLPSHAAQLPPMQKPDKQSFPDEQSDPLVQREVTQRRSPQSRVPALQTNLQTPLSQVGVALAGAVHG